jgi:hypothetical protein
MAFEDEGEIGLALDLLIWHLVALQVSVLRKQMSG